jgi:diacylglycerol kinase (ATP)
VPVTGVCAAKSDNVGKKKAIIIANPASGRGHAREIGLKAKHRLEADNWCASLEFTSPMEPDTDKPATRLSKRYAGTVDRVVVVGGDGTLREVIAGLGDKVQQTTVAFIPLGNANVIARQLDFPEDIEACIAMITNGGSTAMDAGRVNDDIFLAMVGVGYDALITSIVGSLRSTSPGRWFYNLRAGGDMLYATAAILTSLRLFPQRFELTIDGNPLSQAFPTIWVSNTATYSKGWSITPAANACDGWLDYHVCKHAGIIRPLIVMHSAMWRKPAPASISEYGTFNACRIQSERPFRWQMDGDPMPAVRELDIEVLPRYYRIVAPQTP